MNLTISGVMNKPDANAAEVGQGLEARYPFVRIEYRNEPFFNFHFRCFNEDGKTLLIVRFGHDAAINRWRFEALPGEEPC
jgi:hypothetical protein